MLLHFGAIRSKSEYGIALRMNRKDWSRGPGLNRGPAVYEFTFLPLAASGINNLPVRSTAIVGGIGHHRLAFVQRFVQRFWQLLTNRANVAIGRKLKH